MMNLYIYTVCYPDVGESHLNYEIAYAASHFDNVYIVSTKKVGCETSDFLEIKGNYKNVHYLGRAKWTSSINLRLFTWYDIYSEFRSVSGFRSLAKFCYRILLSLKINSYIRFIDNSHSVHYSYWGNSSAIALCDPSIERKLCRMHGSDLYNDTIKSGYNFFQGKVVKSVCVHCISNNGKNYLRQLYGNQVKAITTSYLGVSLPDIMPLRQNMDGVRLLIIASLDKNKRVNEILAALSKIREFDIRVSVFGDGPEQRSISTFVRDNDLNVTLHGNVSHSLLKDNLATNKYDFIINFSRSEGVPVSLMEAMAVGVIPVAPLVGGINELVNDEGGFYIDGDADSTKLAGQLTNIFRTHPDVLDRKSASCIRLVGSKFNLDNNLTAFFSGIREAYE